MKRPLLATLVICFLLLCALGSWTWYFATKTPFVPPRMMLRQGRPGVLLKPRTATASEKQGAIRSIRAQLDAFRRNDYQSAVGYQSQELRRSFGSTAAFQEIIEKSYPQFARYKSVSFGPATAYGQGKTAVIQVPIDLVGQDGVKVEAIYTMIQENGAYRVSGVSGGSAQSAPGEDQNPSVPPGFEDVAPLIT